MTTLNLRAQTAVIQAMQLGRWASHTPQKTTTAAARRARAAMAAGCCALAFAPQRPTGRLCRGALPTKRVRGGKPVDFSGRRCDVAITKIITFGFDYSTPQLRKVCRTA